jgi:hypothetical protein
MTAVEAMNMIESHRFAALTNVASNLKTFLRIAAQQAEVEALCAAIDNDPAVVSEVFQRTLLLAAKPAQGQCEAEGDAALATYLWLLNRQRPELAQAAVARFSGRGHFFWARRLADELPAKREVGDGNGKQLTKEEAAGPTDTAALQGQP